MTLPVGPRVLAACAAVLSIGLAAPAYAAIGSIDDPAGDTPPHSLDVVRATLDNQDHAIVVKVRFRHARRGDLIVSVDPRGARGVRLISQYRPAGTTTNFVLPGAFTNSGGGAEAIQCPGFRVRWNTVLDRARLVLPSTCLQDGDYGAMRFGVLTEAAAGGSDADYAPGDEGTSSWIARG